MKKMFVLTITLVAMVLAVVPQVMAQDYAAMQRELQQVQQDLQAGRITETQAAIRMNEINQKYLGGAGTIGGMPQASTSGSDAGQAQNWALRDQAMQQSQQVLQQDQQRRQEEEQRRLYPGDIRGWPTAAIFSQCSLPNLRQPAGTTVSYDYDSTDRRLVVYIKGGTQTHFNELEKAIAAVGNGYSYRGQSGEMSIGLRMPSGLRGYTDFTVYLSLESDGIRLNTSGSAG